MTVDEHATVFSSDRVVRVLQIEKDYVFLFLCNYLGFSCLGKRGILFVWKNVRFSI